MQGQAVALLLLSKKAWCLFYKVLLALLLLKHFLDYTFSYIIIVIFLNLLKGKFDKAVSSEGKVLL